ncbi:HNH endonuclease [Undibacterium sp. Di27W]|uniref:HNH endonuclease n=1 Tax=Undibacterium sp. Di27W TaxID=3413036 RepID=UPI003BF383A3
MKYLGPPNHDDSHVIRTLYPLTRFQNFPLLNQSLLQIEAEYQHYKESRGDPHLLHQPLALDNALKNELQIDYERKIKVLEYISEIRYRASPDICPLCGSFSIGQVDHVVPKKFYPEFSLFSHNLVPACGCNQTKLTKFKGPNGERFLHPYYDIVLKERICYLAFSGSVDAPDLDVERVLQYVSNQQVKFHIESIVKKTNIFNWASNEWSKIKTRPNRSIFQKKNGSVSRSDIKNMIENAFVSFDEEFGSPNNWKSMFYYGLALREDFHENIRDYVNAA